MDTHRRSSKERPNYLKDNYSYLNSQNNERKFERKSKFSDGPAISDSGIMNNASSNNPLSSLDSKKMNFNINSNNLNRNIKLSKKIYFPRKQGVNFTGLLIGPKRSFMNEMEKKTACRFEIYSK